MITATHAQLAQHPPCASPLAPPRLGALLRTAGRRGGGGGMSLASSAAAGAAGCACCCGCCVLVPSVSGFAPVACCCCEEVARAAAPMYAAAYGFTGRCGPCNTTNTTQQLIKLDNSGQTAEACPHTHTLHALSSCCLLRRFPHCLSRQKRSNSTAFAWQQAVGAARQALPPGAPASQASSPQTP